MSESYVETPSPLDNPNGYAYWLTNRDAAEYAAEYLDGLDSIKDADPGTWAHETADGMAAVIYTGQAVALYAADILDNEDDDLARAAMNAASSAHEAITDAITALSYEWHRRILAEAIEEAIEERTNEDDEDDEDQAPEVTA